MSKGCARPYNIRGSALPDEVLQHQAQRPVPGEGDGCALDRLAHKHYEKEFPKRVAERAGSSGDKVEDKVRYAGNEEKHQRPPPLIIPGALDCGAPYRRNRRYGAAR